MSDYFYSFESLIRNYIWENNIIFYKQKRYLKSLSNEENQ